MESQLTRNNTYNIEYNIPRINLGVPGRQNRSGDGSLRMTPGLAEPYVFLWGDSDGRALNLVSMTATLIFWTTDNFTEESKHMDEGHGELVLSKRVDITDPFKGESSVFLTGDETAKIGRAGKDGVLRWGMVLKNVDGDMFPIEVGYNGSRVGRVNFERMQLPPIDIIDNASD